MHLFDRCRGLNVLLDEITVPSARWARAPRYVSFALTNACDLKCPYCYAPKNAARLDSQKLLGWFTELDTEGCLGVGLGGGEPTLFPGFAELCQQASAITRLAITFTTHGHRISDSLANELRGYVHFIRVSIDGVGRTYERLRGRPFDRLRSQLELVRSIAPFGVNVVVNDQTILELDSVEELALELGAAELLLLPEQPAQSRLGIDPATATALEEWVLSRDCHNGIRLAISEAGTTARMPVANPYGAESPLEAHAHVDASGVLKANAYARTGVAIENSILGAIDRLRAKEEP